jgi:stress responsive alpha/beta barrel protein
MLRHVALFRFREDASPKAVAALDAGLRALPGVVPELRGFCCGSDAGLAEGTADYAVVADFDDEAGWRAYQAHPAHRRVIEELLAPVLDSRQAIQFAIE